jgi:AcrR family transcriptional regulator
MTDVQPRGKARRIGVEADADFEGRRQIVLREAARAFGEKGVQATSLAEIASRLGVSKPALYHYVSNKNEVISEVLKMAAAAVERIVSEADEYGETGLQKVSFAVREIIRGASDPFARCITAIDVNMLDDDTQDFHRKSQRKLVHGVSRMIEEGIEDGSIRECEPEIMSFAILGCANNTSRWYRDGGKLSLGAVSEQYLGLLTKGISA